MGGGNNKLWAESDALPGIKSHSGIDIWYGQDLAGKQLDRILWYVRSEETWPDWVKMLVWYVGGVYGLGKYEDWRFDDEAVDFNLSRRIAELRPVLGNRGAGRFRGAFWYHDPPFRFADFNGHGTFLLRLLDRIGQPLTSVQPSTSSSQRYPYDWWSSQWQDDWDLSDGWYGRAYDRGEQAASAASVQWSSYERWLSEWNYGLDWSEERYGRAEDGGEEVSSVRDDRNNMASVSAASAVVVPSDSGRVDVRGHSNRSLVPLWNHGFSVQGVSGSPVTVQTRAVFQQGDRQITLTREDACK